MKELKIAGLKITTPRVTILKLIQNSKKTHLSADDIVDELKQKNKNIGVATVYRTLLVFEETGILAKMDFERGQSIYELVNGEHHDHLVCLNCHKIKEFLSEKIEEQQKKIAKENGFVLKDHSMVLYGICANCQKEKG